MNICLFTGHAASNAVKKRASNGTEYVTLRIAVDGKAYDRATGKYVSTLTYVNAVVFDKSLIDVSKNVRRGDNVAVETTLIQDSYTDRSGNIRTCSDYVVRSIDVSEAAVKHWHATRWF